MGQGFERIGQHEINDDNPNQDAQRNPDKVEDDGENVMELFHIIYYRTLDGPLARPPQALGIGVEGKVGIGQVDSDVFGVTPSVNEPPGTATVS